MRRIGEDAVHIVQKQLHHGVFLGGQHDFHPVFVTVSYTHLTLPTILLV